MTPKTFLLDRHDWVPNNPDLPVLNYRQALQQIGALAPDEVCAPVLTRDQVYAHPQVRANRTVIEQDHPLAGRIRQTRTPARFSATPPDAPRPARRLGEDTRAVLAQAGFEDAAINEMIAQGVATDTQDASS